MPCSVHDRRDPLTYMSVYIGIKAASPYMKPEQKRSAVAIPVRLIWKDIRLLLQLVAVLTKAVMTATIDGTP